MEKMAAHRIGIALTFARTETEWFKLYVWPVAEALLFIFGRLNFCYPDGSVSQYNASGPSVLIAYSPNDADWLWNCGIQGAFVQVKRQRCPSFHKRWVSAALRTATELYDKA
jgi:hypothetical protein